MNKGGEIKIRAEPLNLQLPFVFVSSIFFLDLDIFYSF